MFKSQPTASQPPTSAHSALGTVVLDVRTPEEFALAHVPGARNIPVQSLAQRAAELGSDKRVPVVIYCRSGARSAVATNLLRGLGFTQVTDIGPMGNWEAYQAQTQGR
jgi:rhodanese-related sulfurtransferase